MRRTPAGVKATLFPFDLGGYIGKFERIEAELATAQRLSKQNLQSGISCTRAAVDLQQAGTMRVLRYERR